MFLSFCVLDDFFRFSKKLGFWYSWSTLLWYRCYYPHRSRDALSPVCGIFVLSVSRIWSRYLTRFLIDMSVVRRALMRTFSSYFSSPKLLKNIGNCFKRSYITDLVTWTGDACGNVLWTDLFSVDGWGGLTLYILTLGLYIREPETFHWPAWPRGGQI